MPKPSQIIPVTVTPHHTLNSSRGVISVEDLDIAEDEILDGLSEENARAVQRIKIRKNNKETPTKHLKHLGTSRLVTRGVRYSRTFRNRSGVSNAIATATRPHRVGGSKGCAKCSGKDRDSKDCSRLFRCVNCEGLHPAYSRSCPSWQYER
ncbi:unnamed protein product, partial [Ixodes hexagonus]